jgi:hypothetical protein
MAKLVDFEREFFKVARDLETKDEARQEFLKRISELSEEWIDDKLRLRIAGLKDES